MMRCLFGLKQKLNSHGFCLQLSPDDVCIRLSCTGNSVWKKGWLHLWSRYRVEGFQERVPWHTGIQNGNHLERGDVAAAGYVQAAGST